MGGDYYDRDVIQASSSSGYSTQSAQILGKNTSLHPSMDPKKYSEENLRCESRHPIVFALDVTGSMGDWPKIIYDKMPMFYGQLMMQGYLSDPAISFCACGDYYGDSAPLQVTAFGQGKDIDEQISKMYLEGGGGGGQGSKTYYETYELPAYFYSRHVDLINPEYPFFFITADEHFYEEVQASVILNLLGKGIKEEKLNSVDIWKELMKHYNVFLVKRPYPGPEPKIIKQWSEAIGGERILIINTPKACIDVILGAIAITSKARDLEGYIKDMKTRGQSEDRITEVTNSLTPYNEKLEKGQTKVVYNKVDAPLESKIGKSEEINKDELAELTEIYEKISINDLNEDQAKYLEQLKEMKKMYKEKIPKELLCPLTHEVFYDPVMTVDGQTFEKKAIQLWFEKHETSPLTGAALEAKVLIPNMVVKQLVTDYYTSVKDSLK